MARLTLDDQFCFYASYHQNPINQWIHILCVWPIFFTALVFLAYTPAVYDISAFAPTMPCGTDFVLNGALIAALLYALYYVYLERPVGVLAAAMSIACYAGAQHLKENEMELFGMPAWQPAVAVHVLGWLVQFYGHGVHEGRSPALVDNLWQAITMAPLFVLLEVCFKLGYRPEFKKRVHAETAKSLKQWQESKAKKAK